MSNSAFELLLVLLLMAPALWLHPWRMLARHELLTPLLATLVILPLLWSLPLRQAMPLQLQWSGACLVALCLGWPLAMLALLAVGALTWWMAPVSFDVVLGVTLWQGMAPATLALLLGALLRRHAPHHPFVYVLGRAFFGTALSVFAAAVLSQWAGHALPGVGTELSWVARWLMAWGDAIVTGMLVSIFVAFRPQWLATWSDSIYLKQ
jgi:uncharacterized membrane protein